MSENEGEVQPPAPPPSSSELSSTPSLTQSTLRKGKEGRPESDVWNHFTKYKDKDGLQRAKCNYCPKSYMSDTKRNDTSSLKAHIEKCKGKPCSLDATQPQLSLKPILEEGEGECTIVGSLNTWRFDQEFCRVKLIEMVIKDELPFSIVDGEAFKEFVPALQSRFVIPSRFTVSRDIFKLVRKEKEKLREYFKNSGQGVCITTDTWTSLQRINYMCITAHFIDDDWKLNKKIINFCTIESHVGEDMGRQIDSCLREWGIKRVFSVTVDNASSNNTCIGALKTKLVARGACLLGGKFLHMRCVAHIVNLVVQDGLKELSASVKKIREAVRFVRQSPARLGRFKKCCEEENIDSKSLLCLDVLTRWNSTYLMLNVACKFEKAFELFEVRDPYYKIELKDELLEFEDWENAKKLSRVLATFYELTNRISGSLYITSNVFLHEITNMSCLLKEWVAGSTLDVRPMGNKMKEKFDKYWGDPMKMNRIIFFAIVIDPRYKFEFLSFMLVEEYGKEIGTSMGEIVKQELYELYDAYRLLYQQKLMAH